MEQHGIPFLASFTSHAYIRINKRASEGENIFISMTQEDVIRAISITSPNRRRAFANG